MKQTDDCDSSGYTDDLSSEINKGGLSFPSDRFENIAPIYVSRSGATQLMSATRYGKRLLLKCLKEDFRYNPVYRTALSKEFEIGISLDHPNVRNTIGFEEIEGLGPSIILEYIDGVTLEELIRQKEITPQKARRIVAGLAKALEYVHSKQVVHRDLKPSNIMITYSGNVVKLIDFSLSDSDTFTVIKVPAGTRSYMDPAQLLPGAKANAKADIYSFGIIVREIAMLVGDRSLLRVAKICSASNPERRPQSIGEVGLPSAASGSGNLRDVLRFNSKGMTWALLILTVALSIWVAFILYNRSERSSGEAGSPDYTAGDSSGVRVLDYKIWPEASFSIFAPLNCPRRLNLSSTPSESPTS